MSSKNRDANDRESHDDFGYPMWRREQEADDRNSPRFARGFPGYVFAGFGGSVTGCASAGGNGPSSETVEDCLHWCWAVASAPDYCTWRADGTCGRWTGSCTVGGGADLYVFVKVNQGLMRPFNPTQDPALHQRFESEWGGIQQAGSGVFGQRAGGVGPATLEVPMNFSI